MNITAYRLRELREKKGLSQREVAILAEQSIHNQDFWRVNAHCRIALSINRNLFSLSATSRKQGNLFKIFLES